LIEVREAMIIITLVFWYECSHLGSSMDCIVLSCVMEEVYMRDIILE